MNRVAGKCGALLVVALLVPLAAFSAPDARGSGVPPRGSIAQERDPEKEKLKKLPRSGTLSSTVTGTAATAADGMWGVDSSATESAPIGGSASKISNKEWLMKVFNNSPKRSFRVQVELVQTDSNGRRLKADNYSYTLKPNQETSRKVSVQANTVNCSLNLVDWKEVK